MPFGLKTAPLLFQKVMRKIFQPLMKNALIYIDDILLYSPNEESRIQLLEKFKSFILKHRIMLSEKKMQINKPEIEFLGMTLKDGQYSLGPHIAQELLKFPDENLSKKLVQQFLEIVNYLRDYIPKVSKKMLKKESPIWSSSQTKVVQCLKEML
ncbi:polyprotein [Gossypium australe]|uniref:Polyprotein n=1 Tax=Gossypium australe TaxID=47621 RepID=A0A5B6VM06_9ROSI|nr:polyprotein [Gossypium australe]